MSSVTPRKPPQVLLPTRNHIQSTLEPSTRSTTLLELNPQGFNPSIPLGGIDAVRESNAAPAVKLKVRLVIRPKLRSNDIPVDQSVSYQGATEPVGAAIGCSEKMGRVTSLISELRIAEVADMTGDPIDIHEADGPLQSEGGTGHLGSHIRFLKTLSKTYENAVSRGLPSFQFFLGGPKVYKRTNIAESDIRAAQILQTEHHLNSYVHLPYLYNLAGSKKHKSLAWQGNQVVDKMMTEILRNIEYELGVMATLSTPQSQNGCVIHVGTWDHKPDGIRTIAESINRIHFPSYSTLLLENSAGSGTTIGRTLDELSQIYQQLNVEIKDHVKICIDTQHIFASGQYDLRQYSEIDRLFEDIEIRFGTTKLGLVHFNDSKSVFNSQVDNHQLLGHGEIWAQHQSQMSYMLNRIERLRIPAVVE
jgi:deoxyribonuclease-4